MSQHVAELIAAWKDADAITLALLILMGVAFVALVGVGLVKWWVSLNASYDPDWNREGNIHP